MAKAADADSHTSVPGEVALTGKAGRGVAMFWSPPL